jgi:HD-GYP domain-containing protein (c-di-GMP phosphodiesterase class II)
MSSSKRKTGLQEWMLHKALIKRLVTVTVIIMILVGLVVYWTQKNRLDRAMRNEAKIGKEMLERLLNVETGLHPGIDTQTALKAYLNEVDWGTHTKEALCRYVFMRVMDLDFHEISRIENTNYPNIAEVKRYVDSSTVPKVRQKDSISIQMSEIAGMPYVNAVAKLLDNSDNPIAIVQGIFYLSPEVLGRMSRDMWTLLLSAMGIVVLTSVLLYPSIVMLLRRLGATSIKLLDANLGTLEVLGSSISKRDSDTDLHNYRVTICAVRIAEAAGASLKSIRTLIKGSFLHDVGKIGISDNILLKPGKLTEEEFSQMKKHVEYGVDIVKRSAWLEDTVEVVGSHHEKYDGSGYLTNLRSNDIPMNARIFAIVDVFDALTSKRPYKEPLSLDDAMAIVESGRGSHFDPQIVNIFTKLAPDLYEEIATATRDTLQQQLDIIIEKYFRSQIDPLMG